METITAPNLTRFAIDTRYPFPQANSVHKLATTVDLVDAGADTDEAVAYLGLLTETDSSPRAWALTPAGAAFLNATTRERVIILRHLFEQVAIEGTLTTVDGEHLADSTAERRSHGLDSCMSALEAANAHTLTAVEQDAVRTRIPVAAAHAATQRAAARERALKTTVRSGDTCGTCFTVMPLTGVCDMCD